MLPELDDTTKCETSKKKGPLGECSLRSGVIVCAVGYTRAGTEDHMGITP